MHDSDEEDLEYFFNHDWTYKAMVDDVLSNGVDGDNRTAIPTRKQFGCKLSFDLRDGFPVLTTKKVNWKSACAEMLGFIRGYDNAEQFRSLGCNVWDANANENQAWLASRFRKGVDDLGRIYGVQWRDWGGNIDQLKKLINTLLVNPADRRMIVTAWNPSELDEMALPPCHYQFQCGVSGEFLDILVNMRSWDIGLGAPFNIVGYAFLLHVLAGVTGLRPRMLHFSAGDYHIYHNHIDQLQEQASRTSSGDMPQFQVNWPTEDLDERWKWIENCATVRDLKLIGYKPHPAIKMDMAV